MCSCPSASAAVGEHSISTVGSLPKPSVELLSAALLVGGEARLDSLLHRYEAYLDAEWYHPWTTHQWVADELVARLVAVCELLDAAERATVHVLAVFFHRFCRTFGPAFTQVGRWFSASRFLVFSLFSLLCGRLCWLAVFSVHVKNIASVLCRICCLQCFDTVGWSTGRASSL